MASSVISFILLSIFLVIVLPLYVVMHFITRWREQRTLSQEEETDIHALWELCETLEQRLHNLEKVMDIPSHHHKN